MVIVFSIYLLCVLFCFFFCPAPRLRKPDLQEVIDFLGSPNDAIKADSAGYLQHLCFMDDDIKAKTR